MPWWRRKVSTTCSPSPWRMRPVSTNTQVSWGPMALCTSAAATAESTPPDRPQMARPAPTWARMASTWVVDDRAHGPGRRRARRRRRGSARAPPGRAACARPRGGTARRRCPRSRSSKAAAGVSGGGGGDRRSPSGARGDGVEVAHPHRAGASGWRAAEQHALGSTTSRSVRPYSPRPVRATSPPSCWAMQLGAVADAQDRDAEVVDRRVDRAARPRRAPTSGRREKMMPAGLRARDLGGGDRVRARSRCRRAPRGPGGRSAGRTGRRSRRRGRCRHQGRTWISDPSRRPGTAAGSCPRSAAPGRP